MRKTLQNKILRLKRIYRWRKRWKILKRNRKKIVALVKTKGKSLR